jgi:hypothetical protein
MSAATDSVRPPSSPPPPAYVVTETQQWSTDAKTTSFALVMIALVIAGIGLICHGASRLPSVTETGFSFAYQLMEYHFYIIACGLAAGAAIMAVASTAECSNNPVKILSR